jgi:ribonuclease P protein subunit POP4
MLLENPARDSRAKKEMDRKREVRKREKEVRGVRRETGVMGRKKGEKRGVWKFGKGEIE